MRIRRPKRPLFPPPNPAVSDLPPARNKGDRPLNLLTATGTVTLLRRYFWSRALANPLGLSRSPTLVSITERWEMLDYRQALARGWDIGSGPTEAMCKNLTLRLKRTGMKWDPSNAAADMNLVGLRESGQWDRWWTRSAA